MSKELKKYGVNELREMYLSFFESKGHLRLPSFSLVPHNDKSLLLINAGMTPLKPYFTGAEIPPRNRVTTCQKCIRTGDIENVGKTARHGTFFEMLGNFSFGDYFKHEAIAWSWEFLTEVVGLDPQRLYPSVYLEDDEAFDIWNKEVGIPADRIFRFGKEDNFWEHGAGPCGPCSEIYYDRGEKYGCGRPDCTVGCECDRYIEVWNNVFTQFDNDGAGHYTTLEKKNIDTGMGLERLAVVVQDVDSIFDVDTLHALRQHVCDLAGKVYKQRLQDDISIRLITDHIRSATFMISDGIMPTNEGRGYVLRRLIRRAARHGRLLGIQGQFLANLSGTVIAGSKDGYPELDEKKEFIFKVLSNEETQFNKTIDQGLRILGDMEEALRQDGKTVLDGASVFKLYDTYGFPVDLTKEILEEKGLTIDEDGFKAEMEQQRVRARTSREVTNYMGADATVYDSIDAAVTTAFVGYDTLTASSVITVLAGEEELVDTLMEGQSGTVFVSETPFYATMGGQEGDRGVVVGTNGTFAVKETIKLRGGKVGHVGTVIAGMLSVGETVELQVESGARAATCKNHSATHLLQKALRTVLGSHVEQKGSLVTDTRLRFDFAHFQAMTEEELRRVEALVNEQIAADLKVDTAEMTIDEAKRSGAMALFGEKYGDTVRVVSMGDYSKELCGGTHVSHTGVITTFKILSESGIAAGVRRIEAITGDNVLAHYATLEERLGHIAALLKTKDAEVEDKIAHLLAQVKELTAENESLKSQMAQSAVGDIADKAVEVGGIKVLAARVPALDTAGLRELGDRMRDKLGEGVVVLVTTGDDKVSILAVATAGAVAKGVHAGNIVREIAAICGGKGGGRPDSAMAGGKDVSRADDVVAAVRDTVAGMLK
ncbi:MAG: alanine--tRNA ligase [Ruminococcaceae bacterium]|nr:alanine--tRNA ligase [Oscillospiraceae bacterium]